MLTKQDLMTLEEVAELLPGRTVRWVKEHLVNPRRVDSINLGARSCWVIRSSFYDYINKKTSKAFPRNRY